ARETFLTDVFWSEDIQFKEVLIWLKQRLPVVTIEIEGLQPTFDPGGVRRAFLFAIFAEIIYNALKYTDMQKPISIQWKTQDDSYVFSCRNTFSAISTKRRGSQRGLVFLNNLTQMIEGVQLLHKSDHDVFAVELHIEFSAFNEGGAQ